MVSKTTAEVRKVLSQSQEVPLIVLESPSDSEGEAGEPEEEDPRLNFVHLDLNTESVEPKEDDELDNLDNPCSLFDPAKKTEDVLPAAVCKVSLFL